MDALQKRDRPLHGFTLVELLVVIVIIGILVGLIVAAVIPARNKARNAAISLEIGQLDMAMKAYKEKFGAYPPDFAGVNDVNPAIQSAERALVIRHLRKAFPRYAPGTPSGNPDPDPWLRLKTDLSLAGITLNNLTPASAMPFWLGGLPQPGGSTKLCGFSANPANPFEPREDANGNGVLDAGEDLNGNGKLDGGSRLPLLFEFDDTRLLQAPTGIVYAYMPDGNTGGNATLYIYFRARGNEYGVNDGGTFKPLSCGPAGNICVPYLIEASADPTLPATVRRWHRPKTFQIIAPGLDGEFGDGLATTFRCSTDGSGFSPNGGDRDNLTNFTGGKLEDAME